MGIGIGGGIGPFRGGISTRGIGVGVGPVSAGTGWGKKPSGGGDGSGCLWIVGILLAVFLIVFPYSAGAWIAEKFGADDPSTTRTVVAWVFEGTWLAVIAFIALALLFGPDESGDSNQADAEPLPVQAPPARVERSIPAGVTFGHKAEPVLNKAWAGVSAYLADDEDVVLAVRVNKISPAVDLLLLTDMRLLACGTGLRPNQRPPFDIPLDSIDSIDVSGIMDKVTVRLRDGSATVVGSLQSAKDKDLVPSDTDD
jgi:hypothetical protein